MDDELTIGQVAQKAGVNVQTLRYYERRGLLSADQRKDSGYRLYRPEAVQKVLFIKNAQALGFTLAEIVKLLKLRVSHKAHCGDVKRRAEIHLKDVKGRIADLQAMEKTLESLIKTCRNQATTDQCPIIKSFEVQKEKKMFSRRREI